MIIPSIDLMNGKAVQLRQGKEKILERGNALELAEQFSKYGEVAVIDLDAALSQGENLELVKRICAIADCRVGGGIRTVERANELLRAGAKKVIIGTKANPEFLQQLPKEQVIAAIDVKEGFVASEGWTMSSGKKPAEMMKELEPYCSEFLFTDVGRDGTMQGCDLNKIKELKEITRNKLTVAGGISSLQELKELEELGVNAQLGMALYTDKIKLDEAFVSLLDFEKNKGLIPTIVQDIKGQVLMLAFSSKESLLQTLKAGKAAYYSRSRGKLWAKGETSGNYQRIVRIKYDCDKDTLLFMVNQKKAACHLEKYSCFGDEEFSLEALYEVIIEKIENPAESSYTSRLATDEELIKEKIREECEEVLNYKDKGNLIWEIADLTYFVLVLMAKRGISMADVKNELRRRKR